MGQMGQMPQMGQIPQMGQMPRPQLGAQAPTMLAGDPMSARPSGLPTTIPGQGPPAPPSHPNLLYGYPSVADVHKQGQMLVVGNGPPRDATSTALVQPTPFGMMPVVAAPTYVPPTISRKTKLLLAGAGLTLLAAIATIAIMKGSGSKDSAEPAAGSTGSDDAGESGTDEPQQESLTAPDPAKPDPDKPDPAKPDPGKSGPSRVAQPETPKPEPPKPETPETPKPQTITEAPEPRRPEPPRPPEPTRRDPRPTQPTRTPPRTQPTRTPPRPQVAVTSRVNTAATRSRAVELYRQRKFSEAANVLSQLAGTISGSEATDLKTQASVYQQLGVAYNRGMSPGAKPIEAYNDLRRALNLDSGSAGGEFTSEIKSKLAQVAPKAAMSFYVRKDYAQASAAVRTAEGNGISNGDTKLVRDKLEQAAKELYDQAASEINTNPDAAKQKLRQIKGMVDGKSPTLQKANQLLSAG
jgi:outer membrane biosynthesis protein TonB